MKKKQTCYKFYQFYAKTTPKQSFKFKEHRDVGFLEPLFWDRLSWYIFWNRRFGSQFCLDFVLFSIVYSFKTIGWGFTLKFLWNWFMRKHLTGKQRPVTKLLRGSRTSTAHWYPWCSHVHIWSIFVPNRPKSPNTKIMGALLIASGLRNSYINIYPWLDKKWLSYEQKTPYALIWAYAPNLIDFGS